MSGLTAIETIYRGYRFRSRLEARWAVFFDAAGILWRYEEQGYRKNGESYLPDFHIFAPTWHGDEEPTSFFVEVRGDEGSFQETHGRMVRLHGDGGCLPGFADGGGLILLGPRFADSEYTLTFHRILQPSGPRDGLTLGWCAFLPADRMPYSPILVHGGLSQLEHFLGLGRIMNVEERPECWSTDHRSISLNSRYWDWSLYYAYQDAKRARFEHGEKGGGW